MKKILLFCAIIFLLIGCTNGTNSTNTTNTTTIAAKSTRFFVVKNSDSSHLGDDWNGFNVSFLVDKKTMVQYILLSGYHEGYMSVLVDENGKPLLYDGKIPK